MMIGGGAAASSITPRILRLGVLATGGFFPVIILGRGDYERVLEEMRLTNGVLFPLPSRSPSAQTHR